MPDESTSTTSTSTTETSAASEGASESTSTENGSSGGSDAASERQSLIDAANEAAAPAAETKAEKKSGATAVADALGTDPGDDAPEVLSIDDILKGREAKQATRSKLEEQKADAARKVEEAQRKLEAADRREAEIAKRESEYEAKMKRLKESPRETFKDLGWDDQKVVDSMLTEGSPEGREIARQRKENEELKARVAKFDAFLEAQEKTQQESQRAAKERADHEAGLAIRKSFLDMVPEESALRTLYSDDDIATQANRIAYEIRQKNRGELVASFEQIRDYLENKANERLAKIRSGTEQKSEPTKQAALQKSGTGSRTLSTSGASERRASPRPIRDMSAAEEREALIAAARDAVQTDK